jgi:phosphatidylinositol-3-phosphatase
LLATLGAGAFTAAAPAAQAAGTHAHIAIIVEENRNLNQVIGASDMPYLNSLARTYASFTHWDGVAHPSEPNYVALVAGSTLGVTDDGHHDFGGTNNLGAQLSAAGVSWKAYMENLPYAGYTGDASGEYVRKHDPFIDFSGNGAHVVPASQYWSDLSAGTLPDFIFYVPNLLNDGHDAGNSVVDASLKSIIPPLMSNGWYTQGAGSVIVTYDEDEGQGAIAHVVVSENARSHATFSGNHYGTLRTIEESYGLPLLGAAAGGTSYRSILGGTAPAPSPSPTPSPATLTISSALDASTFTQGGTVGGSVTVTASAATTLSRIALAARPPGGTVNGGPYLDVGGQGPVSLAAGVPTTIHVSRLLTTSDPVGSWFAFGAVQKTDGTWQNEPTTHPFSVLAAGALPSTPPPVPIGGGAPAISFADVNGNTYWVQAHLSGADAGLVTKVEAQVAGGAWTNLPKQVWGDWAASFFVPAGSPLTFRATLGDGRTATSCAFSHPAGTCISGGGAFAATFLNERGNAWWVETDVATSGGTLAGVDTSVNGGAWIPLAHTAWGSWARSISAPSGSQVRFRADAADGETVVSAAKTWP